MKSQTLSGLIEAKKAKVPVALLTVLGNGRQWVLGAATLPEAGGIDPDAIARSRTLLAEDRSERFESASGPIFIQVFNPPFRLIVVGAVPCLRSAAGKILHFSGRKPKCPKNRALLAPKRCFWLSKQSITLASPILILRTLTVPRTRESDAQIPVLDSAFDHRHVPLAAIEKDKGVDVPSEEIRRLNIVCLVECVLHEDGIVRAAAFSGSR
jgi:hypothetical protein